MTDRNCVNSLNAKLFENECGVAKLKTIAGLPNTNAVFKAPDLQRRQIFFAKQFINFQKRDTKNTENKSLHTFNKY